MSAVWQGDARQVTAPYLGTGAYAYHCAYACMTYYMRMLHAYHCACMTY